MLATFRIRKFHYFSTISLLLLASGIIVASTHKIAALGLESAAFLIVFMDLKKFTTEIQYILFALIAVILAYAFYSPGNFPFLSLSVGLSVLIPVIRLRLMSFFTHTRFLWAEPLLLTMAIVFYFLGNKGNHAWYNWAFPAVTLLIGLGFTAANLLDGINLLKTGQKLEYVEVGKKAPVFRLPDQNGELTDLNDFIGKRDLLLVFVRGDWCPGCHMMLRVYDREKQKFQDKNVFVLAIGPDPVGVNKEMVQKLGLDFKVLSDENQEVCCRYGVQTDESMQESKKAIPLPASFLIDKKGIIRYTSRPDRIGEFLNPATIFPILEQLNLS